jgi:hypothetical protein
MVFCLFVFVKVNKVKAGLLKLALDSLVQEESSPSVAVVDDGEEGEYQPYCKLEFGLVV